MTAGPAQVDPPSDRGGAYRGLPFLDFRLPEAEHHAIDALGSTDIKHLHTSARAFRDGRERPMPATAAMARGSAVHSLVLGGPDVVRVDVPDFRTGDARVLRAAVLEMGAIPLSAPEFERAHRMVDAVRAHPAAREHLGLVDGRARYEVSMGALLHGAPCKARLDGMRDSCTVDIKTTREPLLTPEALQAASARFAYDLQAVHYAEVRSAVTMAPEVEHLIVWVSSAEPYEVAVSQFAPAALDSARVAVHAARALWAECTATGIWPDAPNPPEQSLALEAIEIP